MVVIGYSGTGKSVAIKHIVGLLEPDQGEGGVDGVEVPKLKRRDLYERGLYDQVLVIDQGRQVYFGPASRARAYFEGLGFLPRPRQTTRPGRRLRR